MREPADQLYDGDGRPVDRVKFAARRPKRPAGRRPAVLRDFDGGHWRRIGAR